MIQDPRCRGSISRRPSIRPSAWSSAWPSLLSLAAAAAALALAGCAKDVADAPTIEVSVRGNAAPVTVTLAWGVTESEALALGPDATAAFKTQLPPGTAATVRGPDDCRFAANTEAALALTTKDEPAQLSLGCPGVLELTNLAPSTPVLQTQENLSYQLTLGALRVEPSPEVMITPVPRYPSSTVKVNNGTAPQRLRIGTNSVDVAAPTYGLSRSYSVTLATATAAREHSKVPGPDAAGKLGTAIAGDGDTVVVAQPGVDKGRVLVLRHGSNGWALEATLTAAAVSAGDDSGFGAAVAILGDTVAIGAPFADILNNNIGAVYVYRRSGAAWSLFKTLTTNSPLSEFGSSVALGPGGLLAVGVPGEIRSQGAAYIYAKQGDVLETEAVRLVAPYRDDGDRFGHAVAFAGETRVFIAAPGEDGASTTAPVANDNAVIDSGAVYGFGFTTSWTRDPYYFKSTPMPVVTGAFGQTLAGSGNWFAASWRGATAGAIECISAPLVAPPALAARYSTTAGTVTSLSMDRSRMAFSVAGTGGLEIRTYRLEASAVQMAPAITSPVAGSDFGRAISLAGEHLFVGAPLQAADAGGFYVYE